jgi:hypothetical protein
LEEFSYEHHQKPYLHNVRHPGYTNNFLFVREAQVLKRLLGTD